MNAELLAMLGQVPGVSSRRENEPKTLLSFKAGKMIAELQPVSPKDVYIYGSPKQSNIKMQMDIRML